jgi:hypothetical protein
VLIPHPSPLLLLTHRVATTKSMAIVRNLVRAVGDKAGKHFDVKGLQCSPRLRADMRPVLS